MRYRHLPSMLVCAAAAASAGFVVTSVHAVTYLSPQEAQAAMFPQATEFRPVMPALNSAQLHALAERAGGPPRIGAWRIWQARQADRVLGYVVTDAVIGKFERIDYAVALDADARIVDVEILDYRESHGYEVRHKPWRRQFVGKTADAPLRAGDDIAIVSGATLSCTHLADGIRRIATMAQMALAGH